MKYYRIKSYRGMSKRGIDYSIDQVQDDGSYLCQEAFWFPTFEAAEKRLTELIIEDGGEAVSCNWDKTPEAFEKKARFETNSEIRSVAHVLVGTGTTPAGDCSGNRFKKLPLETKQKYYELAKKAIQMAKEQKSENVYSFARENRAVICGH